MPENQNNMFSGNSEVIDSLMAEINYDHENSLSKERCNEIADHLESVYNRMQISADNPRKQQIKNVLETARRKASLKSQKSSFVESFKNSIASELGKNVVKVIIVVALLCLGLLIYA